MVNHLSTQKKEGVVVTPFLATNEELRRTLYEGSLARSNGASLLLRTTVLVFCSDVPGSVPDNFILVSTLDHIQVTNAEVRMALVGTEPGTSDQKTISVAPSKRLALLLGGSDSSYTVYRSCSVIAKDGVATMSLHSNSNVTIVHNFN